MRLQLEHGSLIFFVFTGCFCMGGGAVGGALLTALHNERLFRLEEAKHRVGGKVGWVRHGLDSGLDVCKFAVHGVDQDDGLEPVSVDRPHLLYFGKQVVYFVDGGAHGGAGNETDLECLLQEKGLRERGGPGVHGVWDWVSGRTHFTLSLVCRCAWGGAPNRGI